MKNRLKQDFDNACNSYLKAFCEKHDFDFEDERDSWVGDDVGGVVRCGDYFVDLTTIRADIDQDAPEEEFLKWYEYGLRLCSVGSSDAINFNNWLRGCPRKSEKEIEELEHLRQKVELAKSELEEAIKKESPLPYF